MAETGSAAAAADLWSYTNVGWCVLGRVMETVTDAPWEVAMRQHLFDGAGMRATTFATQLHGEPRVAGHLVTPGGAVPIEPAAPRSPETAR